MTLSTSARRVERVRHELKRRDVQVARVEQLSPHFRRVTFTGDALRDFVSLSFDDHVKLFFAPADDGAEPARRDYTPRSYDNAADELQIEFALHGEGAASDWAAQAAPGQTLTVAGPKGSLIIPVDYDWHLLVGDETALPAIEVMLGQLPASARATVLVEVADAAEEQALTSAATLDVHWRHRDGAPAGRETSLVEALRAIDVPSTDIAVWAAGEKAAVQAVRTHLISERGLDRRQVRAGSYWRLGHQGSPA